MHASRSHGQSGVDKVDWLWRFLRGIFLLGYTKAGKDLSFGTRLAFKMALLPYLIIPIFLWLSEP